MVDFWKVQLDYILFCYGLAFIIFGYAAYAVSRAPRAEPCWYWLGLFGACHGGYEWLDLAALSLGDAGWFRLLRLVVLTASFALLWTAAGSGVVSPRLRAALALALPPLLALIAAGTLFLGFAAGNGLSRYLLALPAGAMVSLALVRHARGLAGPSRFWLIAFATLFGLYGLFAGLIVPESPLPPARGLNYEAVLAACGLPVQLLRAVLAVALTATLICYRIERSDRLELARRLRRQFWFTLASLCAVVLAGGILTNGLGAFFEEELADDVATELALLANSLNGAMSATESAALGMAEVARTTPLTASAASAVAERFLPHVDGAAAAFQTPRGMVGRVARAGGKAVAAGDACPRVPTAEPTGCFLAESGGGASYRVSVAVTDARGRLTGAVAVVQRPLRREELGFATLGDDAACLVDGDGRAAMATLEAEQGRRLWPSSAAGEGSDAPPVFEAEPASGSWSRAGEHRYLVVRRPIGAGGWSILLMRPDTMLVINRLFGIFATFLVSCLVLVHHGVLTRQIQTRFVLAENRRQLREALDSVQAAQSHLVHSEKMASLGLLVAGIAHELNNPITFIYSNYPYLEQYVKDLFAVIDDIRAEAGGGEAGRRIDQRLAAMDFQYLRKDIFTILDNGRQGASRVKDIVLSLRRFSRNDEGEAQPALLEEGLVDSLAILGHLTRNRIAVDTDFRLNRPVPCQPGQINQVFMNILSNAIQAIEGAGRIRVSTRGDGPWAVVAVADSGRGIPPELVDKIFDPFFTTKKIGEGTGLGLSISHGIVERHGGDISVVSEPGVGTTFEIRLPLGAAAAASGVT